MTLAVMAWGLFERRPSLNLMVCIVHVRNGDSAVAGPAGEQPPEFAERVCEGDRERALPHRGVCGKCLNKLWCREEQGQLGLVFTSS